MSKHPKRRHNRNELNLFASRLRSLRNVARLSQDELADQSGLSRSHIYYLETARTEPGLLALYDLSKVLQVDVVDLVRDLDSEEPYTPPAQTKSIRPATKQNTLSKPPLPDEPQL